MALINPTQNGPTQNGSQAPVVWVTGSGAERVGRQVAMHFAERGYRVALHARSSVDEAEQAADDLESRGTPSVVTLGDVSDMQAMTLAVEAIVDRFERVDAVVHCAAVWDWKRLEETTAADVRHQFEVNTLGSFAVAKSAGLQMVRQAQGGSITLVGDWAVTRPYRDFSAYFVGKGAIETLVRSMAVELATRNPNVRVNGIFPGPVMLDASISPDAAERIRRSCLLQKHGRPEHVAQAAQFLAEHTFVTGVCLPVDGGRTIWAEHETDRIAHPSYLQL